MALRRARDDLLRRSMDGRRRRVRPPEDGDGKEEVAPLPPEPEPEPKSELEAAPSFFPSNFRICRRMEDDRRMRLGET